MLGIWFQMLYVILILCQIPATFQSAINPHSTSGKGSRTTTFCRGHRSLLRILVRSSTVSWNPSFICPTGRLIHKVSSAITSQPTSFSRSKTLLNSILMLSLLKSTECSSFRCVWTIMTNSQSICPSRKKARNKAIHGVETLRWWDKVFRTFLSSNSTRKKYKTRRKKTTFIYSLTERIQCDCLLSVFLRDKSPRRSRKTSKVLVCAGPYAKNLPSIWSQEISSTIL